MTDTADLDQLVIGALKREGMPLKASEIASWLGVSPAKTRRSLVRLQRLGRAQQNELGYWERAGVERD